MPRAPLPVFFLHPPPGRQVWNGVVIEFLFGKFQKRFNRETLEIWRIKGGDGYQIPAIAIRGKRVVKGAACDGGVSQRQNPYVTASPNPFDRFVDFCSDSRSFVEDDQHIPVKSLKPLGFI